MEREVTQDDLNEIEEICYNDGYEIDDIQDAMTVLADDLVKEMSHDYEPDILKGVKFIEYQIKYKQDNNEYDIDKPVEFVDNGFPDDCTFYEAKHYLNSKGYILEDTETNDDDYDQVGNEIDNWKKDWYDPKAKKLLNKHLSLSHKHLDLKDKIHSASNFNIKNLFYGVEKELQKIYKKVNLEATDYDDEKKSQLVRYYFKYNKNSYMLEVMYYDEDGVIVIHIMDEDEVGIERDDFSITTVDKAIKHIVDFTNYHVV